MNLKIIESATTQAAQKKTKALYLKRCEGPNGLWAILHSDEDYIWSVTYLGNSKSENLYDQVPKSFKNISVQHVKDQSYAPWSQFLKNWEQGKIQNIDLKLCLIGTDFQRAVWKTLLKIPYGKLNFYADVCKNAKVNAKAHRAVGSAIGKNPLVIIVPCHRVVRKNGNLGGFSCGLPLKRTLLNTEFARCNLPLMETLYTD